MDRVFGQLMVCDMVAKAGSDVADELHAWFDWVIGMMHNWVELKI